MQRIHIFIAIVLLIALAAAGSLVWEQSKIRNERSAEALRALALEGDIGTLAQKADEALREAPNQAARDTARGLGAYASFMQATPDDRLAAVQIARERYLAAVQNNQRAQALDQLIQFVVIARTPEMYEAVFAEPPFLVHRREGDYPGSVASLAKESYNSRPSIVSAAYQLLPNMAALTNWDREYDLTAEERARHIRAIVVGLPQLDVGLEKDTELVGSSALSILIPHTYHRWSAHIYGRLALEDSTYLPEALERYETALAYYESTRGSDGTIPHLLLSRYHQVPLSYAAFLIALGGEGNLAKARSHLAAVVQTVEQNPELHEGYLAFLRSVAAGNTVTHDFDVRQLKGFVETYPPYGQFIRKYGIVLP